MISGIALASHPQRGRSCSRVCVTWSPTFPHPVFHIPLMWYTGQALHLGSTGNEGSSTPAALAFHVISLIAPACQKRPHLSRVVIGYRVWPLFFPCATASCPPPLSAARVHADSSPSSTTRGLGLCRCYWCGDCPWGGGRGLLRGPVCCGVGALNRPGAHVASVGGVRDEGVYGRESVFPWLFILHGRS